jgi:hypothetical protein
MKSILILALIMANCMGSLAMTEGCTENCDYGMGPAMANDWQESNAGGLVISNEIPQMNVLDEAYTIQSLDAQKDALELNFRDLSWPLGRNAINKSTNNDTNRTIPLTEACNCTLINQRCDHLGSILNAIMGNLSLNEESGAE